MVYVPYCHFLYEGKVDQETVIRRHAPIASDENGDHMIVYLATPGVSPLEFQVQPDRPDDEEDGLGELGALFFYAENHFHDDTNIFSFEDVDGEVVFLRPNDISILSVAIVYSDADRFLEDLDLGDADASSER